MIVGTFVGKPGKCKANPDYITSLFVFSTINDAYQMQAKTQRHERLLNRWQNLLDVVDCADDTPNGQQNNNDTNDSDDEQLKNEIAHDEGESSTFDNWMIQWYFQAQKMI